MKAFFVCCFVAVTLNGVAAPFQNLGFDEANTNNIFDPSGTGLGSLYGPAAELLAGWQLRTPSRTSDFIGYNAFTLGLNFASLYDTNSYDLGILRAPIDGKYALGLYPEPENPFSLIQSGEIPADAKTIRFQNFGAPFEVRINDSLVPLVYIGGETPDDPARAFGYIAGYAGQNVELKFTTILDLTILNGLDNISFSPDVIPEPSTWALLALGGIGLVLRWTFRKYQQCCVRSRYSIRALWLRLF